MVDIDAGTEKKHEVEVCAKKCEWLPYCQLGKW
jgi:hypothetical protein